MDSVAVALAAGGVAAIVAAVLIVGAVAVILGVLTLVWLDDDG